MSFTIPDYLLIVSIAYLNIINTGSRKDQVYSQSQRRLKFVKEFVIAKQGSVFNLNTRVINSE